jgi:hypothetical protein
MVSPVWLAMADRPAGLAWQIGSMHIKTVDATHYGIFICLGVVCWALLNLCHLKSY